MPNRARKRQNLAYEESKLAPNTRTKKIVGGIFIVLTILFIGASAVRYFIPIEEPPVQQNTWKGVTPGFILTPSLSEKLGKPVQVQRLSGEKQLVSYRATDFKAYYNEVIVDKDGVVEFISTPLAYDENNTLTEYISLYGEPDFHLYASHISSALLAHVFLDEGIVVIADEDSNVVEELWYFEPTTYESFMNSWGTVLTEQESLPEAFPL